jgi:CBS domain-containing protein
MITDRDLALKVLAAGQDGNTRVGDVMTRRVFACRQDDSLEQAISLMENEQLRRVPVVDREGDIVGIIAQADIATRVRDFEKTGEVVSEISKPHARAA